jgi:steroid delta-isomerase-like uncharacterized protein
MGTAELMSEIGVPSVDEFKRGVGELPERWLPGSEELLGWAARWLEAWNSHDLDALTELVTDDVVWEDPAMFGETVHGRAEFRAFTEIFLRAFPDVRFDPTGPPHLATEGMGWAAPWRMTATFTGELVQWGKRYGANPPAFAPTGRSVDLEGIDLYEVRDGLLARWTIFYDLLGLSQQLGLIPPADGRLTRLQLRGQRLMAPWLRRRAGRGREQIGEEAGAR